MADPSGLNRRHHSFPTTRAIVGHSSCSTRLIHRGTADGVFSIYARHCGSAGDGWRLFEAPFRANDRWQTSGELPDKVRALALCFDSWDAPS